MGIIIIYTLQKKIVKSNMMELQILKLIQLKKISIVISLLLQFGEMKILFLIMLLWNSKIYIVILILELIKII